MATIAATIADTVAGMQRVLYQNHDCASSRSSSVLHDTLLTSSSLRLG